MGRDRRQIGRFRTIEARWNGLHGHRDTRHFGRAPLRLERFYGFLVGAPRSFDMATPTRITPAEAAAAPLRDGRLSSRWFEGDGIEIRHYAPKGEDRQTPHDRDEFYFVISGSGTYVRGTERVRFGTSIPSVERPGMRSIRTDSALSASARSSWRLTMRLTLTPGAGWSS